MAIRHIVDTLKDRIDLHENYLVTFTSKEGQKVLAHLCKVAKVTESSHTPGDPYTTAFKEGQRSIVTSILKYINKDQSEFIKQVEDALKNE
jgi:hypothetical protein